MLPATTGDGFSKLVAEPVTEAKNMCKLCRHKSQAKSKGISMKMPRGAKTKAARQRLTKFLWIFPYFLILFFACGYFHNLLDKKKCGHRTRIRPDTTFAVCFWGPTVQPSDFMWFFCKVSIFVFCLRPVVLFSYTQACCAEQPCSENWVIWVFWWALGL